MNPSPSTPHHNRARKRGMALIMTIIILALVTVMVLGFADLVRNETISSGTHSERARAQSMADMGVNMVVGTLRQYASSQGLNQVWASMPGALVVPSASTTTSGGQTSLLNRQIPLHSGLPSNKMLTLAEDDPLRPANLNVATLNDPNTHLITDQRLDGDNPSSPVIGLPLRWLYLRKPDASKKGSSQTLIDDAEEPDLSLKDSPIVGRFAWWTDDESSKININTAWKRNPPNSASTVKNPFSASHVSSVNIGNVFTSVGIEANRSLEMADEIQAYKTAAPFDYTQVNRFFNSAKEIRALGPEFIQGYNAAKFELTHYNHDPDTTFFNEPRLVLTTKEEYAPRGSDGKLLLNAKGKPYYLKIKKDGVTDMWLPGTQIDPTYLADTIETLNDYLKREDWPMARLNNTPTKSSFQAKYYGGKTARLTQLSLNIINYVRSKESAGDPSTKVVIPIRGIHNEGGRFILSTTDTPTGSNAYLGISRTPRITEMGLWLNPARSEARYKLEIHLPLNFGIDSLDLTKVSLYLSSSLGVPAESNIKLSEIMVKNPGDAAPVNTATLKAGGYALITRKATPTATSERPKTVTLRYAISKDQRWDITPLGDGATCKLDETSVDEASISSIEVSDPRVSSHKNDWIRNDQDQGKPNTFLAKNRHYMAGTQTPAAAGLGGKVPQLDTDAAGIISDASLYMPPPAGSAGNRSGVVDSPGELGYIHTGMESGAGAGVPWRTLRLQPNNYPDTSVVPDWAFMDLFTVPVTVPSRAKAIFGPHGGTAGRVNLNSQAQPFGNPSVMGGEGKSLERRHSVSALLVGVPRNLAGDVINTTTAQTIAKNIYYQTLATGTNPGKKYGYAPVFDSPGEVVEIKGVADGGEESEAVVRGIANLVSNRGGVFTVYSIGQTLQQTRSGKLQVTAEFRQQTMLEFYYDPTSPGKVKISRMSYQPITP